MMDIRRSKAEPAGRKDEEFNFARRPGTAAWQDAIPVEFLEDVSTFIHTVYSKFRKK